MVTGPSGAGKGTLLERLLADRPELELAVSATTRERRPGERDGREYWFVSDAEFDRRLERGDFLEWVEFPWGQRSATLHSEIARIMVADAFLIFLRGPEGGFDLVYIVDLGQTFSPRHDVRLQ